MRSAVRRDGRSAYARGAGRSSLRAKRRSANSDFVEFVHRLLDMMFTPITYPMRVIRSVLTSPITISVVLKGILAALLLLSSAAFSVLAVGAFWWSWGTGPSVEVEGWLVYGSRTHRMPHAVLPLNLDQFQEDLPYDVQVELELVRPARLSEEMGNFMVTLDLHSLRVPDLTLIHVAQPSLPPPPLPNTLVAVPSFPTYLIPPCIIPWPFRSFCPSRIFGYAGVPDARIKERRRRGTFVSPAQGNEVVLLTKELIEGTVIRPGRGDLAIGSAFVSIGREDNNSEDPGAARYFREVRTTGWVVVRFIPHPTGLRWLLTVNPIPPLLILPPVSFSLTIASALIGFLVISCIGGRRKPAPEEDTEERDEERERRREKRKQERAIAEAEAEALAEAEAEEERRIASMHRAWDARAARDQHNAWDAIESRSRHGGPAYEVTRVVEHPRSPPTPAETVSGTETEGTYGTDATGATGASEATGTTATGTDTAETVSGSHDRTASASGVSGLSDADVSSVADDTDGIAPSDSISCAASSCDSSAWGSGDDKLY